METEVELEPPPGLSIIPQVTLTRSGIEPSTLGIFCREAISTGDQFGPFEGEKVQEAHSGMDPCYVWEIVDLESKEHLWYIDATDPSKGNWMRYIKSARFFEEQNIVSEQVGTDILYKAIKDISPGDELLTWYEKVQLKGTRRKRKHTVPKAKLGRMNSADTKSCDEDKSKPPSEDDYIPPKKLSRTSPHTDMSHIQRLRRPEKHHEISQGDDDHGPHPVPNSEEDEPNEPDIDDKAGNIQKGLTSLIAPDGSESEGTYYQFELKPEQEVKNSLGKKVYKCDICSGVYRHSFSLKRHYIRNHINPKYLHPADVMNCCLSSDMEKAGIKTELGGSKLSGEAEETIKGVSMKMACNLPRQRIEPEVMGNEVSKGDEGEANDNGNRDIDERGVVNVLTRKRAIVKEGMICNQSEQRMGHQVVEVDERQLKDNGNRDSDSQGIVNDLTKTIGVNDEEKGGDHKKAEGEAESKADRVNHLRGDSDDLAKEDSGVEIQGEESKKELHQKQKSEARSGCENQDTVRDSDYCSNRHKDVDSEACHGLMTDNKTKNRNNQGEALVTTDKTVDENIKACEGLASKEIDERIQDNRCGVGNYKVRRDTDRSRVSENKGDLRYDGKTPHSMMYTDTANSGGTESSEGKGDHSTEEKEYRGNLQQIEKEEKSRDRDDVTTDNKDSKDEAVQEKGVQNALMKCGELSEESSSIVGKKGEENGGNVDYRDKRDKDQNVQNVVVDVKTRVADCEKQAEINSDGEDFPEMEVCGASADKDVTGLKRSLQLQSSLGEHKTDFVLKESQKTNIKDCSHYNSSQEGFPEKHMNCDKSSDLRINGCFHATDKISVEKEASKSLKSSENRHNGLNLNKGEDEAFKLNNTNGELSMDNNSVNHGNLMEIKRTTIQDPHKESCEMSRPLATSHSMPFIGDGTKSEHELVKAEQHANCGDIKSGLCEQKKDRCLIVHQTVEQCLSSKGCSSEEKSSEEIPLPIPSEETGRSLCDVLQNDTQKIMTEMTKNAKVDSKEVSSHLPAKHSIVPPQLSRELIETGRCIAQHAVNERSPALVNTEVKSSEKNTSGRSGPEDAIQKNCIGSEPSVIDTIESRQTITHGQQETKKSAKTNVDKVHSYNTESEMAEALSYGYCIPSSVGTGDAKTDKDIPGEASRLVNRESRANPKEDSVSRDRREFAEESGAKEAEGDCQERRQSGEVFRLLEGLFRCNICEDLFDSAPQLKDHIRHHPGNSEQAMWSCDMCDMKFKQKKCLMRHQAVHSKKVTGKSRDCRHCGKYFASMKYLKRHERLHESVRHTCEHCATSFSQAPDLKKHIRRTHPTAFHPCAFCPQYFSGKRPLHEHLQKLHQKSPKDNKRESSKKESEMQVIDPEMDKAESIRLATEKSEKNANTKNKYACTVCKKVFLDYTNMCRHRSLAHQRHLLEVVKTKKPRYSIMNTSASIIRTRAGAERESEAFYTNIGRNVRENLTNHMMGTQGMISHAEDIIKWDIKHCKGSSSFEVSFPKKDKNSYVLPSSVLSRSNFPKSFRMWDPWNKYRPTSRAGVRSYSLQMQLEESDVSNPKEDSAVGFESGISTQVNGVDVIGCQLCHSVFQDQGDFEQHVQEAHPLYPASTCRSPLPAKSNTDIHIPISLQYAKLEQDCVIDLSKALTKHDKDVSKALVSKGEGESEVMVTQGENVRGNSNKYKSQENEMTLSLTTCNEGGFKIVDSESECVSGLRDTDQNPAILMPSQNCTDQRNSVRRRRESGSSGGDNMVDSIECENRVILKEDQNPTDKITRVQRLPEHGLGFTDDVVDHMKHHHPVVLLNNQDCTKKAETILDEREVSCGENMADKTQCGNQAVSRQEAGVKKAIVSVTCTNSTELHPKDTEAGHVISEKNADRSSFDSSEVMEELETESTAEGMNGINTRGEIGSSRRESNVACTNSLGLMTSDKNKVTPKPTGPAVCTDDPGERFQRFLCKACYQEFGDWLSLRRHKEEVHPTIEFDYTVVDHSLKQVWYNQPKPAGLLNVTATQLPTHEVLSAQSYKCTKCSKRQKDLSELHSHIIDCADPESLRPKYVWVYQYRKHRYSKMKQKRTCGWQKNTPRKAALTGDTSVGSTSGEPTPAEKSDSIFGSSDVTFDLFDEVKKRRRRPFELLYNPNRHTRRREMAEVVTTAICSGCNVDYKTISMLERHIPSCTHKEKIRELESMKPMYGPDSSDSSDTEDYDPTKHLCIYCLRQFTYLGSLRNHIFEICTVRKEFVKQGEYLDQEWEEELIKKTGGRREPLSRHSSLSSIAGNLEEENSQDSADTKKSTERSSDSERKIRRKRRGFGWAQKNKSGNFTKTVKRVESKDGYVYEYYIESEIPVVSFDISDTFILDSDKAESPVKTPNKGASHPTHRPAPYVHHHSSYHDDGTTAQDLSKNGVSNESSTSKSAGKMKKEKGSVEVKQVKQEAKPSEEDSTKEKPKKGYIRGPYKKKVVNMKDVRNRRLMLRSQSPQKALTKSKITTIGIKEESHSKLSAVRGRKRKAVTDTKEVQVPKRKYTKKEHKVSLPQAIVHKRKYRKKQLKEGVSLAQSNTDRMVDLSKKRSIKDILKSKKTPTATYLERALATGSTSKTVKKCLKERITQKKLAEKKLKNKMRKAAGFNGLGKHKATFKTKKEKTETEKGKLESESEKIKLANKNDSGSKKGKLGSEKDKVKLINKSESNRKPGSESEKVNIISKNVKESKKGKVCSESDGTQKGKAWNEWKSESKKWTPWNEYKSETKKGKPLSHLGSPKEKMSYENESESKKAKAWKKKSVSSFTLVTGIHINKGKTIHQQGGNPKETAENCGKTSDSTDIVTHNQIKTPVTVDCKTAKSDQVDSTSTKRKYCKKVKPMSVSKDLGRTMSSYVHDHGNIPVFKKKSCSSSEGRSLIKSKTLTPKSSPHFSLSVGGTPCDQIVNHIFLNSTLSQGQGGAFKRSPGAGSQSAPAKLAFGRGQNPQKSSQNTVDRGVGGHGKAKRMLEL